MLLKTTMYLDLHIFHMRDHKDRGGQETGNLRKQFENSEIFSFIFQIRKQQETRKNWIFPSIWSSLWFYVAVLQWKTSKIDKNLREKFSWKSWFLRIFRLWEALFLQNLFEFSVFVVTVGKISSSSSQSRKKNSKIHWYGLFLAGRSWQNFDATPSCNS